MNDVRKAAIFLLSLEKPVAAEVMSGLPKRLVEAVTMEIARVKDVSKEQQDAVMGEFQMKIEGRTPIERGGLDFANELLSQSLGPEFAAAILSNIKQSMSSVPFGFLHKAGAENLLTFINDEHPQTIALIMSHLPPPLAAEVLAGLAAGKQLEVIRRVASMEQTSPEVIKDVEKSLELRMTSMIQQQTEKAGGVPMVAQILNVTDRMTNKGVLESLEEEDEDLVEEIKRLMFIFDDILKLDNKAIQTLLKEVDNTQWATALKGATEEIQDKILGNLSQRAAEMLREEMDFLGPIRVSDVEEVQQQIVDTIRRLEDAGEIQIAGGDGDQFVT